MFTLNLNVICYSILSMKRTIRLRLLFCILWVTIACVDALAQLQPALADSFFNFIKANKNRSSVYISKDDSTIARLNENKMMPLGNTVNIMVAVEFAMQASANMIDKDAFVSLYELEKYHISGTDSGAYEAWIDYEKMEKNIVKDSIALIEVARGMTMFNSNANTEYLMDLLGFDNVKNNHRLFELRNHTALFPYVSSMFMFQNLARMKQGKLLREINKLTEEEYCRYAFLFHQQMKDEPDFKSNFRINKMTPQLLEIWSDRLTASTTKEYVNLVKILNNRKFLNENAYGIIAEILEFPMEKKQFQEIFKQYGGMSGSTGFALTQVIYFTSKEKMKMEMAVFFNDLTPPEELQLKKWWYSFEAQVIFDEAFQKKLKF